MSSETEVYFVAGEPICTIGMMLFSHSIDVEGLGPRPDPWRATFAWLVLLAFCCQETLSRSANDVRLFSCTCPQTIRLQSARESQGAQFT